MSFPCHTTFCSNFLKSKVEISSGYCTLCLLEINQQCERIEEISPKICKVGINQNLGIIESAFFITSYFFNSSIPQTCLIYFSIFLKIYLSLLTNSLSLLLFMCVLSIEVLCLTISKHYAQYRSKKSNE